jgi:hypothetical protein
MKLIGIILTYNEEKHIQACIESLRFTEAIIVFDSFSTDDTVKLAREAGAEVIQRRFDHYANQRNAALAAVEGRAAWVLFVDADERVTPELAAEVQAVIEKPSPPATLPQGEGSNSGRSQTPQMVSEKPNYAGWRIPRHNIIFGKLTRGAGWYPDYQTRLLRVGSARYDPARQVHEVVILDGNEGTLRQPFVHLNYETLAQFAAKQRRYSAYDAQTLYAQGVRPKPQNYLLQPWRQFWWRFVTLKGYQDGLHGLRLSALMGWYELRKYWLLGGLWRTGMPN